MNSFKVYLLAGLGFDRRIFDNLKLDNIDHHFLEWIEPHSDESFEQYVYRLKDLLAIPFKQVVNFEEIING